VLKSQNNKNPAFGPSASAYTNFNQPQPPSALRMATTSITQPALGLAASASPNYQAFEHKIWQPPWLFAVVSLTIYSTISKNKNHDWWAR